MKTFTALLAAVVLCLALAAHAADDAKPAGEPAKAAETKADPKDLATTETKFSYMIGYQFATTFAGRLPVKLDMAAFQAGVQEGTDGKECRLSEEQQTALEQEIRTKMAAEAETAKKANEKFLADNKKADEKFLADNKKEKGVKTTDSGLQITTVKEGTGASPKATDIVKINYKGTLVNGTEFDNSYTRGAPLDNLSVKDFVPGFGEGLQLMKVGGKYKLAIPGDIAYGANPPGPPITPNAALLFEVELLDIMPPAPAASAGMEGLNLAPPKAAPKK